MSKNKTSLRNNAAIASMRATKAFTIARVSSDEQEEYSPDAQDNRMSEYCHRNSLAVLEAFQITESSTRGDRKEFMEIISKAKAAAKKLNEPIAIITDKVDRLQRGFKQQPLLEEMREKGLLEYHFSSDNCVIHRDSPAKDLFMWNISVALAQNYTDSLRDNVKRAIEQKLRSGEWVSQAPIGYLNKRDATDKRDGRGKAHIVIDPVRAPLVKQLFEKYATDCYSISQLVKFAKEIGLTNSRGNQGALNKSHVHKLIQEPFYYGVMKVKKTGEEYPHRYETIINKPLFDKCQEVRQGKGKPHSRYGQIDFLFRGILTCANTGKLCTAQTHKKKYKNGGGASFTYVVSHDANDPKKIYYTREDNVIEQLEAALGTLTICNDKKLKDILSYVRSANEGKKIHHKEHTGDLKREHTELERKLERLTDLRLEGELTKEEFISQKQRLKNRQYEITDLLHAYDVTDDEFCNKLNYMVTLASGALEEFRSSGFDQKRELLNYIFQNLKMNGKKLEYTMAKPFEVIADCNKTGEWCCREDLNFRPLPYQGSALPLSYGSLSLILDPVCLMCHKV